MRGRKRAREVLVVDGGASLEELRFMISHSAVESVPRSDRRRILWRTRDEVRWKIQAQKFEQAFPSSTLAVTMSERPNVSGDLIWEVVRKSYDRTPAGTVVLTACRKQQCLLGQAQERRRCSLLSRPVQPHQQALAKACGLCQRQGCLDPGQRKRRRHTGDQKVGQLAQACGTQEHTRLRQDIIEPEVSWASFPLFSTG